MTQEIEYKCRSGRVWYSVNNYPSCCGIGIIHDCRFYPKNYTDTNMRNLKEAFHKYLGSRHVPFEIKRSLILMADKKGGDMDSFCIAMKWKRMKSFENAKTGRIVRVYSLERAVYDED